MNLVPRVLFVGLLVSVFACATPARAPAAPPGPSGGLPLLVDELVGVGVPLFEDEKATLREAVAQHVSQQADGRWTLVPLAESEALVVSAEAGRHPKTGLACAAPSAPFSLLDWSYPKAGLLSVLAACKEPRGAPSSCELTVVAAGPKLNRQGRREELARWAATVRDPGTPEGWLAAARALVPAALPAERGGLGLVSFGADRPVTRVWVGELLPFGPWERPPSASDFASVQPALDACWRPRASGPVPLLNLEVSRGGEVARCERRTRHGSPPDPFETCLCQALLQARLGAGAAGRRLQVNVHRAAPPRARPDGRDLFAGFAAVQSKDGFAAWEGVHGLQGLERCFADAPPARRLTLTVGWSVRADGGVEAVRLPVDGLGDSARRCLEEQLGSARFPCPLDADGAEVEGTLEVWHAPKR